MAMGKLPRGFWSYTAGKGDLDAEERQEKWMAFMQGFKETWPGFLGLGVIGLIMMLMLGMMFAEFRGCGLVQFSCLMNKIPLLDLFR